MLHIITLPLRDFDEIARCYLCCSVWGTFDCAGLVYEPPEETSESPMPCVECEASKWTGDPTKKQTVSCKASFAIPHGTQNSGV